MRRSWLSLFFLIVPLILTLLAGCDLFSSASPGQLEFSHVGNTYFNPIEVSMESRGAAAIHYTIDGSTPTRESQLYRNPVRIDTTTRLRAIAIDRHGKTQRQQSVDYIIPKTSLSYPYLDVSEGNIYHVSSLYEYSLDDGKNWQPCIGPVQSVKDELSPGAKVWVRHQVVASDLHYLGHVQALAGYDLQARQAYVMQAERSQSYERSADVYTLPSAPDYSEFTYAIPTITNIGNEPFTGKIRIDFYASEDPIVTMDDQKFLAVWTKDISLAVGETMGQSGPAGFYDGLWDLLGKIETIPGTFDPYLEYYISNLVGDYYIGYYISVIEDTSIPKGDLLAENNWTLPQFTDPIRFVDPSKETTTGAFKVVNSHGIGTWESVDDGHYWIPFDAAIDLEMILYYSLNDFSQPYRPTLLAKFWVEHADRSLCRVSVGVGSPEHPIAEKLLQTIDGAIGPGLDPVKLWTQPFPDNPIVLDISEFAPYIATNDLFLRIDNVSDTNTAMLKEFSIELHAEYTGEPPDDPNFILDFDKQPLPESVDTESQGVFAISTIGKLDPSQLAILQPNSRSFTIADSQFELEPLNEQDIQQILGFQKPDTSLAESSRSRALVSDGYTGGLLPPTESELREMVTLRSINPIYSGSLPSVVDLSATQYFPPIANQGQKGSCAAFSNAYYIQTYNEAREHGWDLSGAQWVSKGYPDPEYPGYPTEEYQDKIMSPDFTYHQASNGMPGATFYAVQSVISRIGSSTWKTMPYENFPDEVEVYSYPWPSEEAYREAAMYRSRLPGAAFFDNFHAGVIVLDSMAKVEMVQQLLASGYCISTGINAHQVYKNLSDTPWLTDNDVLSLAHATPEDIEHFKSSINHAQTIVGYKAGSSWNSADPEK